MSSDKPSGSPSSGKAKPPKSPLPGEDPALMHNASADRIHFEGNVQHSTRNIANTLANVTQNIGNIPNLDPSSREELKQLVEQLQAALLEAPPEKIEEVEAVTEMVKALIQIIWRDKPSKAILEITLAGLKKASENLGTVLPVVLPITGQIADLVSKLFGLS